MTDVIALPPIAAYELAFSRRGGRALAEQRFDGNGTGRWIITDGTNGVLTSPGYWERGAAQSRDEDVRATLEEALSLWERQLVAAGSGGTWGRLLVGSSTAAHCERIHDPGRLLPLLQSDNEAMRRAGSWIGADAVALHRVRTQGMGDWQDSHAAADLEIEMRRILGVHALDLFRQGCASVVLANRGEFQAEWAGVIEAAFGKPLADGLARDLYAAIQAGTAFRIGLATLGLCEKAVVAQIVDRRPGIDFAVAGA